MRQFNKLYQGRDLGAPEKLMGTHWGGKSAGWLPICRVPRERQEHESRHVNGSLKTIHVYPPEASLLRSRHGCALVLAGGGADMRKLAIVTLCAALSGCATKYQEMGFTGGVAAQQITADTWRIQSRGNAYTGAATVQDFVLLKAAETATAAGATHFQIINAADASRSSTIVTPGATTTTLVG